MWTPAARRYWSSSRLPSARCPCPAFMDRGENGAWGRLVEALRAWHVGRFVLEGKPLPWLTLAEASAQEGGFCMWSPEAEASMSPGSIVIGDRILSPSAGAQLAVRKLGGCTAFVEVYSDGRPPKIVTAMGPPGPQLQALQAAMEAQSSTYLITAEQSAAAKEEGAKAIAAAK